MKVFIASFLMLLGAVCLIAPAQWWRNRWTAAGRWIGTTISPHVLVAAPAGGLFLVATGVVVLWPPGVILAAVAGAIFVVVLLASGRRSPVSEADLREPGEPAKDDEPARRAS